MYSIITSCFQLSTDPLYLQSDAGDFILTDNTQYVLL